MSKPYLHHDEYHDIGKAVPKPKRPTQDSPRKKLYNSSPVSRFEYQEIQHWGAKRIFKGVALVQLVRQQPRPVKLIQEQRHLRRLSTLAANAVQQPQD